MVINFCYDDLGQYGIGYPNLAKQGLEPDQFDTEWPRVVPLRLLLHLTSLGVNHRAYTVADAPQGSWYPIAWAWHDFACDYLALIPQATKQKLRSNHITILFYYHEGDNPKRICEHLHDCCDANNLPRTCFVLVSANGAADNIPQCIYFPDHEYFFRWLNRRQQPKTPDDSLRPFQFTALNRLHKNWRSHIMADLWSAGILSQSLWSYNTNIIMPDADAEHPLNLCSVPNWQETTRDFLSQGPYICDCDDSDTMNDHSFVNQDLFERSYFHIVIETMLDADGSNGCFLSEKTYKCIKYGQPFIIIGTAGSLESLKTSGYRTFDQVIDPTYDTISDATERYHEIKRVILAMTNQDLNKLYRQCLPDVLHNQQVFLNHAGKDLSKLTKILTCNH